MRNILRKIWFGLVAFFSDMRHVIKEYVTPVLEVTKAIRELSPGELNQTSLTQILYDKLGFEKEECRKVLRAIANSILALEIIKECTEEKNAGGVILCFMTKFKDLPSPLQNAALAKIAALTVAERAKINEASADALVQMAYSHSKGRQR